SFIQTHSEGTMRVLILNRPKVLNALTPQMLVSMTSCLVDWENSEEVDLVILKSSSGVFCAGGDLIPLMQPASSDVPDTTSLTVKIFQQSYRLQNFLAKMSTPVVCFMDGITFGAGLGLALHIPFRIATENTRIAFPETSIGLYPEVGATFFLPRMDGELGAYFGLTGVEVHGWQAYQSGFASHYISSASLASLQDRLSMTGEGRSLDAINRVLTNFSVDTFIEDSSRKMHDCVGSKRQAIDHCFKQATVEMIIAQLQEVMDQNIFRGKGLERWAKETKERILARSPSSSKLTLLALREGGNLDIEQCFEMELKLSATCCIHTDFFTGGTHLIKKQRNRPAWRPSTLEDVSLEYIRQYFFSAQAPPSTYLPPSGYISTSIKPYKSYPHAHYSLPGKEAIKGYVNMNPKMTRTELIELIERCRTLSVHS
ncbi:uncharacterized protein MELLADRAFT_35047, partial [Melampsora larici-populina 98AG31]